VGVSRVVLVWKADLGYDKILSTGINAAILALLDAGIPLKSMVASVTCVTTPSSELLLDPSIEELKVCWLFL
jgi:exosome complex component RRP46